MRRIRGHAGLAVVVAALFLLAGVMLTSGHSGGWVALGMGLLYLSLLLASLLSGLKSRRAATAPEPARPAPAGPVSAGRAGSVSDAAAARRETAADVIVIHPMEGYAYRLLNGRWYEVGSHGRDSLLLLSGTTVKLDGSADPDQYWMISGRAEGGRVALAGFVAGRFSGARRSADVGSLLAWNPKLLRGQLVSYRGMRWEASETLDEKLSLHRVSCEPQLVDADALVAENLDQLLERVVMIVDSG